jgi:hypothetical protein
MKPLLQWILAETCSIHEKKIGFTKWRAVSSLGRKFCILLNSHIILFALIAKEREINWVEEETEEKVAISLSLKIRWRGVVVPGSYPVWIGRETAEPNAINHSGDLFTVTCNSVFDVSHEICSTCARKSSWIVPFDKMVGQWFVFAGTNSLGVLEYYFGKIPRGMPTVETYYHSTLYYNIHSYKFVKKWTKHIIPNR